MANPPLYFEEALNNAAEQGNRLRPESGKLVGVEVGGSGRETRCGPPVDTLEPTSKQ